MKHALIVAAGCAWGAVQAQESIHIVDGRVPEVLRPISITPVLGFTPSGMPILGEPIHPDATTRGDSDPAVMFDTLLDASLFEAGGDCPSGCGAPLLVQSQLISQVIADDFSISGAFAGSLFVGGRITLELRSVGPDRNLLLIVSIYDSATLSPALNGTAGFDNDNDGTPDAPYKRDSILGAALLDFGAQSTGFYTLEFDGLAQLDIPLPSQDFNGDSLLDGTYEIGFYSDLIDTDGDGFIDLLLPVDDVRLVLGGSADDFPESCFVGNTRPELGDSTPGVWGEGAGALAAWSNGGTSLAVDGVYDPAVDLKSIASPIGSCISTLNWGVELLATAPLTRLCADTNQNGIVDPGDFGAWVAAFNANEPIADVNQNGAVDPGDFGAWVSAFNLGADGPFCSP